MAAISTLEAALDAEEAADDGRRRDLARRWLLSAPALIIVFFAAIGPLGRRREAQPVRRQAQLGREPIARARQVVTLVEHHQPEARPEVVHVRVR